MHAHGELPPPGQQPTPLHVYVDCARAAESRRAAVATSKFAARILTDRVLYSLPTIRTTADDEFFPVEQKRTRADDDNSFPRGSETELSRRTRS